MSRIVGLTLVRDEDFYVEQAIRNALSVCDEVIALEHRSIDRTPEILAALAAESPKLRVHRIRHPRESHEYIAGYAGSPVWVLGFDGDQLLDATRLRGLRDRLLEGEFDAFWTVSGMTVNCISVDRESETATGHIGPPARGTPKLFNFAAIDAWRGPTPERLHSGTIDFRPGYSRASRTDAFQELGWDETPFRWLHVCFLRRSSRRPETIRVNPAEAAASAGLRNRVRLALRRSGTESPDGKVDAYRKGPLATVDARPFFAAEPRG